MGLPLDELWAEILSRNTARIIKAWQLLDDEEQESIRAHLIRMMQEDGWAEPQRISAAAALRALDDRAGSSPA